MIIITIIIQTIILVIIGSVHYRICRCKGRSIFGRENIKKSGCGLYDERVKKKKKRKSKPAQICTYGTTNGKITIPLWYRTFPHILPTILSCIVDMKTKINVLTQHLPIDLDLSLCQLMHCKSKGRDRLTELPRTSIRSRHFVFYFMQFRITPYIVVGVYIGHQMCLRSLF